MIFNINYIVYIIYSFIVLFVLYVCLQIYKKYSYYIYKQKEKVFSSEKYSKKQNNKNNKNKNTSNNTNKIKNLKNKFKIKSTEKTFEDIKFITNKPNYINVNNSNNNEIIYNLFFNNDMIKNFNYLKKIKNYNNDEKIQQITKIFLSTKQEFYNTFVNTETDEYFIKNLNDFCSFHKTINNNTNISNNNNILLKFYNVIDRTNGVYDANRVDNIDDINDVNDYIYVFVSKNKMTKIVYNDDYNNISSMIEKNNGIFVLTNDDEEYYVGYGNYIQSTIDLNNIKNLFFSNIENCESDKNYKLFSKFKFIKIYFYICNKII